MIPKRRADLRGTKNIKGIERLKVLDPSPQIGRFVFAPLMAFVAIRQRLLGPLGSTTKSRYSGINVTAPINLGYFIRVIVQFFSVIEPRCTEFLCKMLLFAQDRQIMHEYCCDECASEQPDVCERQTKSYQRNRISDIDWIAA